MNNQDINKKDERGITKLIEAIQENDFIKVKVLIDSGADVNIQDNDGFSPLMIACLAPEHNDNNLDIIKLLLNKGANISICTRDGLCAIDIVNPHEINDDFNHKPWKEAYNLLKSHKTTNAINSKDVISEKFRNYIYKINTSQNIDDAFIEEFISFIFSNNIVNYLDNCPISFKWSKKIKLYCEIYLLLSKRQFEEATVCFSQSNDISSKWFKKTKDQYIGKSLIEEAKIRKDLIVTILALIDNNDIDALIEFIIKNDLNEEQIVKIKDLLKMKDAYSFVETIHIVKMFKKYNFEEAEKLFDQQNKIDTSAYYQLKKEYLLEYIQGNNTSFGEDADIIVNAIFNEDVNTLSRKISEYEISIDKIKNVVSDKIYNVLRQKIKFFNLLSKYNFKEYDNLLKDIPKNEREEWLNEKAGYVSKYFKEVLYRKDSKILVPDDEQIKAISNPYQNILVTARAGSGKTTTIINKVIFEIEKYNLKSSNIKILAFNKNVRKQINTHKVLSKYSNEMAHTFHSLAHKICSNEGKVLRIVDEDSPNKSSIITRLLEENLSLVTRENMYVAIRNSCIKTEDGYCGQLLMDDPETLIPLPQKYMADFLFEHKFQFDGEDLKFDLGGYLFYDKDRRISYSADFKGQINDKNIYIRYISSPNEKIQERFNNFRQKKDILLEFCCPFPLEDILKERNSHPKNLPIRNAFEKAFEKFLQDSGNHISCLGKREKEELLTEFFDNYKPHFNMQCESLINHYQQKTWELKEIKKNIKNFIIKNPLHEYRYLLEISIPIYEQYKNYLRQNNKIDFNTLMVEASKELQALGGNNHLTREAIKLKREIEGWKLLCIDEFQDFSQLFFNLVKEIKNINPEIKLFCVGDDWQAINGFAGSDTNFFTKFEEYIKQTFKQNVGRNILRTNYRSTEEILEMSNSFMHHFCPKEDGAKGKGKHELNGLCVIEVGGQNSKELKKLSIYKKRTSLNILTKADALFQIMKDNASQKPNYFILARRERVVDKLNSIYTDFLEEINARYGHGFYIPKEDFTFSTIHKSKGLERDIVIILVDNNSYPLYHPTSEMIQALFGLKWKEEERNLFYVALTRAKKKVYFVTSNSVFKNNEFTRIMSSYKQLKKLEYLGIRKCYEQAFGFPPEILKILFNNQKKN